MSDLGRCTSGRRVVRKNTPPGLARENFPEPDPTPHRAVHGEVAFFQNAQDAIDYVTMADRIQAVRDLHQGIDAVMNPGRHERIVKVCTGCGTDDGNWQHWPCPTIRALGGER